MSCSISSNTGSSVVTVSCRLLPCCRSHRSLFHLSQDPQALNESKPEVYARFYGALSGHRFAPLRNQG